LIIVKHRAERELLAQLRVAPKLLRMRPQTPTFGIRGTHRREAQNALNVGLLYKDRREIHSK